MRLLISGATGFIGTAVVNEALARGHRITILTRDVVTARTKLPADVHFTAFDGHDAAALARTHDALIHLAWADVGKYTDPQNFTSNVEPQFRFLKQLSEHGLRDFTIAGSCLEYGLQEGRLMESAASAPVTYYGLAKNTLWQMLRILQRDHTGLRVKWLRYFYVYGPGQREKALLPQLLAALSRGDDIFRMSRGDQGRDFVHIDTVAANTMCAAESSADIGIVNIGSGRSMKVLDFVNAVLKQTGRSIELDLGAYGYPAYEPFAFHADVTKLLSIPGMKVNHEIIL